MKSTKLWVILILINIIFTSCLNVNNKPPQNKIPIIEAVDDKIEEAAAQEGKLDIKNSPYYKNINFYKSSPTSTLIKLNKFKTYQQTSDWSCGACCALMTLNYFGISNISENNLVKEMDVRSQKNPRADGSYGATTQSIVNIFKTRGFNVISSYDTQNKDGISFKSEKEFYNFVVEKLKNNCVIIIENVEFGGHWRVIIGYDDMGNKNDTSTHVIVFADPYDTTDHSQNGYAIESTERFFESWFDNNIMPKDQKIQQYICISK